MLLVAGGVSLARLTALSRFLWPWLLSSWASVLVLWLWVLLWPTSSGHLITPSWILLFPLQGPLDPLASRRICMDSSRARSFILIEAIRFALVGLRGIISGLERALSQYEAAPAASAASRASTPPGAPSVDWDVVSGNFGDSVPSEADTRSLPPCPLSCLDLCNLLGPTESVAISRAKRAWEAGCWAKVVAEGKVPYPRATPPLPGTLRNSVYVILQAPGLEHPVHVRFAAAYFKIIPKFEKGGSISHAFPTVAEAKVYCFAFGIPFPALHQ